MRHVIVGNGPAGVNAALTLRRIAPQDRVTLVAEEAQPFYSKVVTSYFVAGKSPYENLLLADAEQFRGKGIELLTGRHATAVDVSTQEVEVAPGGALAYDRLLLATGAAPAMPPIEGVNVPSGTSTRTKDGSLPQGVFTLWTHDDAVKLKEHVQEGGRAVVVGAGLVGLKAAEALLIRGLSVTVVELMDRVLPQVLAREDAARVQKILQQKGLVVRTGTGVARIGGDGRAEQVVLSDGTVLACDVMVLATGVRPKLALAKSAGAAVGRGILVDEFMQTTVRNVFAAGDVAEGHDLARGRKTPNPTWGNASEQGRIAACNMAGQRKPFRGAVSVNTFTFLGFSMAAIGITQPEDDFYRSETHADPRSGDYRKVIMLGDRLVGGVAMGDVRMAGVWRALIARRGDDGPLAAALLPRKPGYAAVALSTSHHELLTWPLRFGGPA